MAVIPDLRWRALDSNGNPISGATLTIYTAGTTTPAAIYRDAALAVPMSNPTSGADKSDAAGRFPQIYAATNLLFDVLEKDASGSTIASYLSVPSLGSATASLALDFTTSRMMLRGTGGVSYLEFGDASGDDIGGTGSIGGWNGTQADLITLNAVLVNVTGHFKEGSYKLPGVVRTEAQAFTTVSNVVIPLTNDPTGVRMWEVDVLDLAFSVGTGSPTNLTATVSVDGGATYIAAGYIWSNNISYITTNAPAGSESDTSAFISKFTGGTAGLLRLSIVSPNSGAGTMTMMGQLAAWFYNGSAHVIDSFMGKVAVTARVTHLKLTCTSGTMSGVIRVVPHRGLGET